MTAARNCCDRDMNALKKADAAVMKAEDAARRAEDAAKKCTKAFELHQKK
jgi:hypothetical protein